MRATATGDTPRTSLWRVMQASLLRGDTTLVSPNHLERYPGAGRQESEARRFYTLSGGLGSPGRDTCATSGHGRQTPAVVASWIRVFLAEAEQLFGRVPIIYRRAIRRMLRLVPYCDPGIRWGRTAHQQNYGQPADDLGLPIAHPGPFGTCLCTRALPWRPDAWTLAIQRRHGRPASNRVVASRCRCGLQPLQRRREWNLLLG